MTNVVETSIGSIFVDGDEAWGYLREETPDLIKHTTWFEYKSPYFKKGKDEQETQIQTKQS